MNIISKSPVKSLGYDFIPEEFLPKGKDEYWLRLAQNRNGSRHRKLSSSEIRKLEKNLNSSDDWSRVEVSDPFDPSFIKNCQFYGWVRIGKLEPFYREFNNLRLPVGLYNSTIISCDIGDNPVIDQVSFISHYIVGHDVMLVNINEMATTDHSKFGNGILKKGEKEPVRIWLEVCNENGGRSILPFDGMLPGDAWLWSRHRNDEKLMQRFREFTESEFDQKRGRYGMIGDRSIIKNCRIIKDVMIGSDAYIKGINKLKNLTINSSAEEPSQIGEGCELVNGIIGYGCRVFYGVKAVRFILSSNSQLKYGARLINSYLGDNSTISCCEVLNSLIFPAHEQHHNNSFLCAALVMGQSNMAAGATIGSNHNSRSADGEIIAGRGFWPGLCVSLKHNSRFASFILIAKGDFPAELDIPIPFSLVSNDVSRDRLVIMPAYWPLYNMYALARNAAKYESRDKRRDKTQLIEYDCLAPDSINEIFDSLSLMKKLAAKAFATKTGKKIAEKDWERKGEELLEFRSAELSQLEILAPGFENSDRKVELIKLPEAFRIFRDLIIYYGVNQLILHIKGRKIFSWKDLQMMLPNSTQRGQWKNVGGQLMPQSSYNSLIRNLRSGKTKSWAEVHAFYRKKGDRYPEEKFRHAYASLLEILKLKPSAISRKLFIQILQQSLAIKESLVKAVHDSRAKDYEDPFRKMVYENEKEMDKVMGKLEENSFIIQQQEELQHFREQVHMLIEKITA